MNPEGEYDAEIEEAWVEQGKDMRICLRVSLNLSDDTVSSAVAKHPITGQWGQIGRNVIEHLELPWPEGLETLDKLAGRAVRVRIKHKIKMGQTYENAYVMTGESNTPRATAAEIAAAVAQMRGSMKPKKDDVPF